MLGRAIANMPWSWVPPSALKKSGTVGHTSNSQNLGGRSRKTKS